MKQTFRARYPIADLEPHPDNPKPHDDVSAIAESLDANGFFGAVLVQQSRNRIIARHGTVKAAAERGETTVPVLLLDVDDDHALRIMLADNRTAELSGYDDTALASILESLPDLAGTGYTDDDVQRIVAMIDAAGETDHGGGSGGTDDADVHPVDPSRLPDEPVTRLGDVWIVGDHRIVCGDARELDVVAKALDGRKIQTAITSPPYADRRKYDESSGFEPIHPTAYVEWYQPIATNILAHLTDAGSYLLNIKAGSNELSMERYVLDLVIAHIDEWGWNLATEYCWERGGVPRTPTRRFKNGFEPIYQFTRPGEEWTFNPKAVRHLSDNVPQPYGPGAGDTNWAALQGYPRTQGQTRTSSDDPSNADRQGRPGDPWWSERTEPGLAFPSNRLPTMTGSHEAVGHGAAFPVGLPAFFAKVYADEGATIFDPFLGSGSTILAAEQTNRVGVGIELSPKYCDILLWRIERATGIVPKRGRKSTSFIDLTT